MNTIRILALFIATAAMAVAAPEPAVNPATIQDKVNLTLGQKLHLTFKLAGERLLQPTISKGTDGDPDTVTASLYVTDATPVRVKGVPTRPYIVVSNGFARTLHFRALARRKGSKAFFAIDDLLKPAAPGEASQWCWESGSLIEEVILYEFALAGTPAK